MDESTIKIFVVAIIWLIIIATIKINRDTRKLNEETARLWADTAKNYEKVNRRNLN